MSDVKSEQVARPTPPDLEFRYPDCPFCDKEVSGDGDSLCCENCKVWWSSNGTSGEWMEDADNGCPSLIEWFNTDRLEAKYESIRHERERCILPFDHFEKHRGEDSWHTWKDDDPRIVASPIRGGDGS